MTLLAQKIEELAKELVIDGVLTEDQLAVALESKKNLNKDLSEILIQRGYVSEKEILKKLGKKCGVPFLSVANYKPDPAILKILKAHQARQWKMIPLFEVEDKITIAAADPFNLTVLDEVRTELRRQIDFVLAPAGEIEAIINKYYNTDAALVEGDSEVEVIRYEALDANAKKSVSPIAQLEKEAQAGKVVDAVNTILRNAYQEKASDIHMEPIRDGLKIRFRIDGVLEERQTLLKEMHQPVVSRIKILGGMDVAERRTPQDGRVRIKIIGKEMDLRIATYPTMFGEAAAIRLLTKDQLITMEGLGFLEEDQKIFQELITKPHGILLVTGPTGSGKTTTLYAALQQIDRKDKHVLSVEDPIEHEIEGVDQTQINTKAGVTFASAIRSMLRQDPDVIMVGEIRDQETADIAFRAAMTGHLVFSTLHTNTAIGAIARLTDLGVEPYLISSSLLGVVAQRLVRRLCSRCKTETKIAAAEEKMLGLKAAGLKPFKGKGCKECRMTGYRGRVGLFELVQLDEELRVLVNTKAPEVRIREKVKTVGHHSILEDGIEKIRQGVTTVEEVLKVATE